jgi:hypothetical protein
LIFYNLALDHRITRLHSVGLIKYWLRKNVDRINSEDNVSFIDVTLKNKLTAIRNDVNNKFDRSVSLDSIRILLLIIEVCFTISLLRLIYEKVYSTLLESLLQT